MEKWHRRTVQIELGRYTLLLLRRLVCQDLHILLSLNFHVKAAWHRLRGRDVPVRIDLSGTVWCPPQLFNKFEKNDRYLKFLSS